MKLPNGAVVEELITHQESKTDSGRFGRVTFARHNSPDVSGHVYNDVQEVKADHCTLTYTLEWVAKTKEVADKVRPPGISVSSGQSTASFLASACAIRF